MRSGNYFLNANSTFGPDSAEWTYTDTNPTNFYSSYISGAQRLKGGNTLICDGAHGTFFEVDNNKTKVWKYINPIINSGPLSQGTAIASGQNGWVNATFRCTRYAPNYPAFLGRNLVAGVPIELNPIPSNCDMSTTISEQVNLNKNKELLYITDLLGRKTSHENNKILFFIYDDGTVVKKLLLE